MRYLAYRSVFPQYFEGVSVIKSLVPAVLELIPVGANLSMDKGNRVRDRMKNKYQSPWKTNYQLRWRRNCELPDARRDV